MKATHRDNIRNLPPWSYYWSFLLPLCLRRQANCKAKRTGALLPAASRFYFGRAVDEVRHVSMQLLARLLLDVHHVAGFVIGEADIFADRRLQAHVRDGVFDAVEGRGHVVIAAEHKQLQMALLRHRRTQ